MKLVVKQEKVAVPAPSTLDRMKGQIQAARMRGWARPKRRDENGAEVELDPRLPVDLTRLNDSQIGALWTQFCAVLQWAKGVHTLFAVEAAEAKRLEKWVRAKAFLRHAGHSREERAAAVEVDREVVLASEAAAVASGTAELSYAVFDGYLTGKEAVSRELTRRIELERNRTITGEVPRGIGRR